ncbi:hypothetical protein HZA57_07065 [Candidatus Poribacteria bacterium]|nr:hypothetical protein [Candidatus Poribacteria bacterium]
MKPDAVLRREAVLLARYLLGVTPPAAMIERYVSAHRHLPIRSSRLVQTARRHPRLLPLLDAWCAARRPNDPLRRKLLLMTAILEASPDFTDRFLSWHVPLVPLISQLAWNTVRGAIKSAASLPVGAWLSR